MNNRERGLETLDRINQDHIQHLKRTIKWLEYQNAYLARWLIAGGELTILGKPVQAQVTWPEGRPHGLADEQILEMIPLPSLES